MNNQKSRFFPNSNTINQFLINLSILLLTWGGLFRKSFNCDTLIHMLSPTSSIMVQIQDGRYLNALIDYILYQFGVSTTTHTGITTIISLFFFAMGLCYVQNAFRKIIKQNSVLESLGFITITALLFSNVLFGESLMFSECTLAFGLGYLFASMGIYYFTRRQFLTAAILFFLATTGYQITVVYAAIVLSAYIFLHNECHITKKAVTDEFLCGLLTFGSGLLNMISYNVLVWLKISPNIRKSAGTGHLLEKLSAITELYSAFFKNSKGLLPSIWIPLIIFIFCLAITLYTFIKKKNKGAILYYSLLFIAINMMIFIIPMMQEYIYMPPRIIWTLYAIQAMLLLIAFACQQGRIKNLVCYTACAWLIIQIIFCNVIVANRTLSNSLDITYTKIVYEKIMEYEEASGQIVKRLAVTKDTNCPFSYEEVKYKTDQINERALGTVTNTLMNVVSERTFEKAEMDEAVNQTYFAGKNWDYFDVYEQLVIQGDTAYWVIF